MPVQSEQITEQSETTASATGKGEKQSETSQEQLEMTASVIQNNY